MAVEVIVKVLFCVLKRLVVPLEAADEERTFERADNELDVGVNLMAVYAVVRDFAQAIGPALQCPFCARRTALPSSASTAVFINRCESLRRPLSRTPFFPKNQDSLNDDRPRKGGALDSATRNIYSAGSEWCSCITRHRPSIFRRHMVNRNSSFSRLPFAVIFTHRPIAVANATFLPAVIFTS